MKIILDIPDSVIPPGVRAHINQSRYREQELRAMLKSLLDLCVEEFENCEIGVDEYRLVLK